MSIDQLTPERRAIAERATAIIKACIGGVALSEAVKTSEAKQSSVITDVSTFKLEK